MIRSVTSFSVGSFPVAELFLQKSLKNLSIPILYAGESFFFKAETKPLVLINTGQIAFTLIDLFPSSLAKDCVIPFTANLLDEYAELFLLPLLPAILDMFIMDAFLFKSFKVFNIISKGLLKKQIIPDNIIKSYLLIFDFV